MEDPLHVSGLSERGGGGDLDLGKVCRLCLRGGNEVLAPIFGSPQGSSLSHRIMACAQIKVIEGDGLPPNVCAGCLSQVDRSYQFKLLCERSDSTLRGNIKTEAPSEDECSDNGEIWDMTKFTPEVIIKEDLEEHNLPMNGNCGEVGYPGSVGGLTLAQDSLGLRLSQGGPIDLRTSVEGGLILNGLVFPLPSPLSHLSSGPPPPPPGPSNNGRSRRCRSGDKLFKCRQCNKSYSFSSALSRHKAVHNTALRPHVCKICKKGFADLEKLMRHEKTHNLDILITCDLCHRPFKSYSAFQRHRSTGVCRDAAEEEDEERCSLSEPSQEAPSRKTEVKLREKSHLSGEEGEEEGTERGGEEVEQGGGGRRSSGAGGGRESGKGKPEFKCPVCQKLFATRGSLDVHSTIHTGVRPFVCSVCHKSFRHKVNLMEHFQRKHSQVRPYICDVCASRFVTKQELVRHYRKHIGD